MQLCGSGCIDCVHAERLPWLLSLLYSPRSVNGQSTWVTPMSHWLEVFTDGPVTGCKTKVRARIHTASHKPKTHSGEICCCQLLVL